MDDNETRDELNRLYWQSDESVSDIADRLDISRRALYDGVEPAPAGVPCPECDGELGFRNRTTAESGEAECAECGHEVTLQTVRPEGVGHEPQLEQESAAAPLSPTRRVPPAGDGALSASGPGLGAMLLAGIGLGAAVTYVFRRG